MTQKEIENDIKSTFGSSFISKRDIKTYMGYKKNDSINKIVDGLEAYNKRYFVPEVARRIKNESK